MKFSKAEESFYKQKSRATWIAEGDNNTAYFHNYVKDRINRNKIQSLMLDDGTKIFDPKQIHKETFQHFQERLRDPRTSPPAAPLLS